MDDTANSFADKLNRLFEEKKKPDGTQYSKKEVLDSSPALNRLYLWRIQTGKVAKPSYEVVKALADFFGVHPSYFFENYDPERDLIQGDQKEELQVILRNFGLDRDQQRAVMLMIESLRRSKS